jgi:hypothetical protein
MALSRFRSSSLPLAMKSLISATSSMSLAAADSSFAAFAFPISCEAALRRA